MFLQLFLLHSMPQKYSEFSDTYVIKLLSLDKNIKKTWTVLYGGSYKRIFNPKRGKYIDLLSEEGIRLLNKYIY